MSTKNLIIIFFTLLYLSISSELSSLEIIPKYGKKKTWSNEILLDVSDFDSGDKIYISITTYSYTYVDTRLNYKFYENINGMSSHSSYNYVYESSSTSSYSQKTYDYKIKKNVSNAKYLYMSYNFELPVTIENTADDISTTVIIIIVVSCVVFFAILITLIVCCCKRCRARRYGIVQYPGTVGYGFANYGVQSEVPVVQSTVPPVGIAQPYYNYNPQYNQAAPAPIISDIRVNPNANYEKPM